jgi:hypothetical protein
MVPCYGNDDATTSWHMYLIVGIDLLQVIVGVFVSILDIVGMKFLLCFNDFGNYSV